MKITESGAYDFVARQRTPTYAQIFVLFVSAALIATSLVLSIDNIRMLIATNFALFAIIGWYLVYQLMRSRDALLATEFQNALFTSAMGLHNKFCIIMKRDGTIIYLDRSFQTLFPDFTQQPNRSVELLLKQGKVMRNDYDRVMHALDQGVYDKVIFDIVDAHGLMHHIILSIEPISRPSGFIMLRGREYIENRSVPNETPRSSQRLFDKTSVTLFASVMENMKMGIYMASPTGNLIYCNPLLEQWLGYGEGEIVARNLSIHNLLPLDRNTQMTAEPSDIEGDAYMGKKVGGFIKIFLNQKIIHNDEDKILGCTAIVHMHRQDANVTQIQNPHF